MPGTTALAMTPSHTADVQVGTDLMTDTALASEDTSSVHEDQEQGEEEDLVEDAPVMVDYF